jgi:signal transduction histidine kinase
MVMIAAVPVVEGMQVIGAIYGGVALNRNEDIVDQIQDVVYGDEEYNGAPLGTTTIFLKDSRITTTVRRPNGNRAIGTRVSREVAERVLDNGRPWIDRAFVVSDWYLSAYEPIKNLEDEVIGILYVGILEEPFNQLGRQIMLRYAGLLAFSLAAALVIAFVMAGRVAQPIHRLVEATKSMQRGEPHTHVPGDGTCAETESLIHGFNDMAEALEEREARLQEANGDLTALNRSYMDMLGFVSHELKSPVSSIMNYVYLLRQEKIGPMTEKQAKAAKNIETNSKRIVEMVRHYLNLSRIETGELQPVMTTIHVLDDLLQPLLESLEGDVEACGMSVKNDIDTSVVIHADANMAREAFENLVSNAVKYGRNGTEIQISADADEDFVTFRVANEGEGIRADQIEHLFDKFSRLEGEDAVRWQKGTGLGLFITKHIVEAHGGIIKVESTPGEWTVFTFSLPREKNPEEA